MQVEMDIVGAFNRFSLLPAEIRAKIWVYALPEPRVVDIHFDVRTNCFQERTVPASTALVDVNVEARIEVFRYYSAYFGTVNQPRLIFVDMRVDVVRINFDAFRRWKVMDDEFENIRYLELSKIEVRGGPNSSFTLPLGLFPKLEQLILEDPRSPFVMRPQPQPLSSFTTSDIHLYAIEVREYRYGQKLENLAAEYWDSLVRIARFRKANTTLPLLSLGMVGITETGERHYQLVGDMEDA